MHRRVSTEPTDPGHRSDAHRFRVRFNGALCDGKGERPAAITADEEAGLIRFHRRGPDGRFLRDPTTGALLIFERRGRVEIIPPPPSTQG